MSKIRNVVVLGDSFSDIGKKRFTMTGRFATEIGKLTTNPTGRFSDCRNWTDFMFQAATGRNIIGGTLKDSIANSRRYMNIGNADPVVGSQPDSWFNYANYAEGGATGIASGYSRMFLGTLSDQVKDFCKDYRSFARRIAYNRRHGERCVPERDAITLFIIWIGANDVFTVRRKTSQMAEVAYEVGVKQRLKLQTAVGRRNCRFIYIGCPTPGMALAFRHNLEGLAGPEEQQRLLKVREAALELNRLMMNRAARDGDVFVNPNDFLSRDEIAKRAARYMLKPNHNQKKPYSKYYRRPSHPDLAPDQEQCAFTSDQIHPSDRLYKYFWDRFNERLFENRIRFGNIGPESSNPVLPRPIGNIRDEQSNSPLGHPPFPPRVPGGHNQHADPQSNSPLGHPPFPPRVPGGHNPHADPQSNSPVLH